MSTTTEARTIADTPVALQKAHSRKALEATNFFLADVQTGLGPFLAAYLAADGWKPDRVGFVLTLGGLLSVLMQTPAGAIVDRLRHKRVLLVLGSVVLAAGALLLTASSAPWSVYTAQAMIGFAAPFLGPTLAAITMGLVGTKLFDRQFGRNQSWNAAGNVASALLIAGVSHLFGNRAIFIAAAVLTLPTIASVLQIHSDDIDYELARGGREPAGEEKPADARSIWQVLLGDPVLLLFLLCAFLFHMANAAMLPQLGEMLSHGHAASAAPFMSACVIVTQLVIMASAASIGRFANAHGRKPLLLLAFGVLPFRAVLYTMIHATAGLIAVQLLDGVANAIFGVVAILVVADRTRGSGRFNLVQGALATAIGIGAALSNTVGGKLAQAKGYDLSFLVLGGIAAAAFLLLLVAIPETRGGSQPEATA